MRRADSPGRGSRQKAEDVLGSRLQRLRAGRDPPHGRPCGSVFILQHCQQITINFQHIHLLPYSCHGSESRHSAAQMGCLLRVSQGQMPPSQGVRLLSGGPGEESAPRLTWVNGRIQLHAVVEPRSLFPLAVSQS